MAELWEIGLEIQNEIFINFYWHYKFARIWYASTDLTCTMSYTQEDSDL